MICGILEGMIPSSVFLMTVALAHNGRSTGPALRQLLLRRLHEGCGGVVWSLFKVWFHCECVCLHRHVGAFKTEYHACVCLGAFISTVMG